MTNEEINALTDPQINLMMALNDEGHQWTMDPNNKERHVGEDKDYCNDPAVMMPITESQGISIVFDSDDTVTAINGSVFVSNGECVFTGCTHWQEPKHKYCRAAAIVYLKMREVL